MKNPIQCINAMISGQLSNSNAMLPSLLYSICIFYMQYSKYRWKIIGYPLDAWMLFTICHAEIGVFWALTLISQSILYIKKYTFIILTFVYYLFFVDFVTWFSVGRPFLPTDLYDSTEIMLYYPEFIIRMGLPFLIKTAILALIPVSIVLMQKLLGRISLKNRINQLSRAVFWSSCGIFLIAAPFIIRQGYFSKNSLYRIAAEIRYQSELSTPLPHSDVMELFGKSGSRSSDMASLTPTYTMPSVKRNVIVYIIETAISKYYPDFSEYLKGIGRNKLMDATIRFTEHYCTFPQSERAIYSIVSGKYPPVDNGYDWINISYIYAHSLPQVLKEKKYVSYFLSTAPLDFHNNISMVRHLGFDHIEDMEKAKAARVKHDGKWAWDRKFLYPADEELLEKSLKIIDKHSQTKEPYVLMLAPQASHAPFQVPPDYSKTNPTDLDLIRANAYWQFGVIMKIVDRLNQIGQMENSILVITGDHGIRSSYESKQLFGSPNILKKISFNVPLWIIEGSRKKPLNIDHATSHIDIVPTLLDMLRIGYDPLSYHGRSVFIETQRTLFFLGGNLLPVNGYKKEDCYFMENRYLDYYAVSPTFGFEVKTKRWLGVNHFASNNCGELDTLKDTIAMNIGKINMFLTAATGNSMVRVANDAQDKK